MSKKSAADKLNMIRLEMTALGVDALLIPHDDEYMGEYLPESAERLAFVTDFTGSHGEAIVTKDKAALFTGGIYTLQAKLQVDQDSFELWGRGDETTNRPDKWQGEWIAENMDGGQIIGYVPWLHTESGLNKLAQDIEKAGSKASLKPIDINPVDLVWGNDRPSEPKTPAVPHPVEFAGKTRDEKLSEITTTITENHADAAVLSDPLSVCWLLNIRGQDLEFIPITLCRAIVHKDKTVKLFINPDKLTNETKTHLNGITILPIEEFDVGLKELGANKLSVMINAAADPIAIKNILTEAGATTVPAGDPCILPRAIKNKTEQQGQINAHIRDGVAMAKFLCWLEENAADGSQTEISVADQLEQFRSEGEHFKGLSFATISGAGENGAIIHYRVTEETNRSLNTGELYLVDSGAQYLDGTTDITRTIAIGEPTEQMCDHFTRVLKGHIQVALYEYEEKDPEAGYKMDELARASLKEAGLDYGHGTGHGVSSYLSVHEGPQRISPISKNQSFYPGMITSNEPGYYKEGAYGIRIESLVITEKDKETGKLKNRTITLAPVDRNLIKTDMLTDEELEWLNDYHKQVRETLSPLVDAKTASWLQQACTPVPR